MTAKDAQAADGARGGAAVTPLDAGRVGCGIVALVAESGQGARERLPFDGAGLAGAGVQGRVADGRRGAGLLDVAAVVGQLDGDGVAALVGVSVRTAEAAAARVQRAAGAVAPVDEHGEGIAVAAEVGDGRHRTVDGLALDAAEVVGGQRRRGHADDILRQARGAVVVEDLHQQREAAFLAVGVAAEDAAAADRPRGDGAVAPVDAGRVGGGVVAGVTEGRHRAREGLPLQQAERRHRGGERCIDDAGNRGIRVGVALIVEDLDRDRVGVGLGVSVLPQDSAARDGAAGDGAIAPVDAGGEGVGTRHRSTNVATVPE